MDFRKVKLIHISLLGLAISGLAACGGGGGENTGGSPDVPPNPVTDTGIDTDTGTDNAAGSLSFSHAAYSVSEAEGSIVITVNRQGDSAEPVSVDFSVIGGSATEGEDFAEVSGTLEWAASDSTPKTFKIEVEIDPLSAEQEETVNLSLSSPIGASLGQISTASLTIGNTPCTEVNSYSISESITFSDACYIVERNMLVKNAATLTVSPNVHMFFTSGTLLEIDPDGILNAVGTAEQPIVFTGEVKAPGYWDGIEVASLATSQIKHAIVEYGGSPSAFIEANFGVISGGKLSVQNTISRYSAGNGAMISGADSRITAFSGNTITLNHKAPVLLPVNHVGMLTADSSYTGNQSESGENQDYIHITGNTITTSQDWDDLGVSYRMPSTKVHAELTIAPGTRIEFLANSQLNIDADGTLKAIGTQEEPIVFTGLQSTPGYWTGIQFTFNNQSNELDYTVIEYAGGPGGNVEANLGVFGDNGRLSLKNTVIQYSERYGFSFSEGIDLEMDALLVTGNASPGRMSFKDTSKISDNSSYTGNTDDRITLTYWNPNTVAPTQIIKKLDVPYYANNATTMKIWNALEIKAGTEIQFNGNGGFNVDQGASLAIKGTAEDPVVLTGAQKVKGYWKGIQYTFSNSPANVIEHAVIEYGGGKSGNTYAIVGLFGSTGLPTRLTMSDTTLRGSLTNGIELSTGSTVNFSGNTFIDIDGQDILDPR